MLHTIEIHDLTRMHKKKYSLKTIEKVFKDSMSGFAGSFSLTCQPFSNYFVDLWHASENGWQNSESRQLQEVECRTSLVVIQLNQW